MEETMFAFRKKLFAALGALALVASLSGCIVVPAGGGGGYHHWNGGYYHHYH
jgi:hypothetical protein